MVGQKVFGCRKAASKRRYRQIVSWVVDPRLVPYNPSLARTSALSIAFCALDATPVGVGQKSARDLVFARPRAEMRRSYARRSTRKQSTLKTVDRRRCLGVRWVVGERIGLPCGAIDLHGLCQPSEKWVDRAEAVLSGGSGARRGNEGRTSMSEPTARDDIRVIVCVVGLEFLRRGDGLPIAAAAHAPYGGASARRAQRSPSES